MHWTVLIAALIQAVATIGILIVTFKYARQTKRMADSSEELNRIAREQLEIARDSYIAGKKL